MKYPLYILPNQLSSDATIQGKRETFEQLVQDFKSHLPSRKIVTLIEGQLRSQQGSVIKIKMTRANADELLRLAGLSY